MGAAPCIVASAVVAVVVLAVFVVFWKEATGHDDDSIGLLNCSIDFIRIFFCDRRIE